MVAGYPQSASLIVVGGTPFDRLTLLRDCLCAQIVADGLPPVCFCEVVPGEAAAGDYFNCNADCGGMAWVRLTDSYRTESVGTPNSDIGNCGKQTGMDVELGIMRCANLEMVNGYPPPPDRVRETAALQLLDMETMVRAVDCCPSLSSKDYVIGSYSPLGPEGGVVGGTLALSII